MYHTFLIFTESIGLTKYEFFKIHKDKHLYMYGLNFKIIEIFEDYIVIETKAGYVNIPMHCCNIVYLGDTMHFIGHDSQKSSIHFWNYYTNSKATDYQLFQTFTDDFELNNLNNLSTPLIHFIRKELDISVNLKTKITPIRQFKL